MPVAPVATAPAAVQPIQAAPQPVYQQPAYQQPAQPVYQQTIQPVYQQPVYQQPVYNNAYQQPYNPLSQMTKDIETANTLGIVSLVCSLLGAAIFAIAAIVTGIIGMNKIKPYMNDKVFPNDKAKSAYNLGKAGMIIAIVKICLAIVFVVATIVFAVVFGGSFLFHEIANEVF
jgi:hypothetical protein